MTSGVVICSRFSAIVFVCRSETRTVLLGYLYFVRVGFSVRIRRFVYRTSQVGFSNFIDVISRRAYVSTAGGGYGPGGRAIGFCTADVAVAQLGFSSSACSARRFAAFGGGIIYIKKEKN